MSSARKKKMDHQSIFFGFLEASFSGQKSSFAIFHVYPLARRENIWRSTTVPEKKAALTWDDAECVRPDLRSAIETGTWGVCELKDWKNKVRLRARMIWVCQVRNVNESVTWQEEDFSLSGYGPFKSANLTKTNDNSSKSLGLTSYHWFLSS